MPFDKESAKKYGAMGGKAPKAKTHQWENLVGWLTGDGGVAFKNKIASLSVGAELTKPEKEFLEHYKDLLEYHQPKLSRAEVTGKDGKDLPQPILYNALPSNDSNKESKRNETKD